ncbi:MAG: FkbM family methyltransferase [Bacteroidetes bacterium]|nr:FkbM family methyltransferase [Bacteroidota bacterium]
MIKLLSHLYKLFPFKKELFTILKSVWQPPENVYKHLHFKGEIKIQINNTLSFQMQHYGYLIENELFWRGINNGWEKISLALWMELCKTATTIIDIGANTGIYALAAKTMNPQATVYAFEPIKRVYEKLQYNCKLNKMEIISEPYAISNTDGYADIYDTTEDHVLSVSLNRNFNADLNIDFVPVRIPVKKLDSIVESGNISRIDLLKIDTETHEPEVLEGYKKYLVLHKPTMLIEILNDEVAQKIEKSVSGLGYLFFNIDEQNPPKQVLKLTKSDYYNFLLCDEQTAKKLKLIYCLK